MNRYGVKIRLPLIITCLILVSLNSAFAQGLKNAGEYVLGVGDSIEISVYGSEDLIRIVTIRPDGRISFPLAGEIKAEGLTPQELDNIITAKLSSVLKEPRVSVIVTDIKSKRVLVLGEVAKPGVYTLSRNQTALEAIMDAGGYTSASGLKTTMIIKRGYTQSPEVLSADLWSVFYEGNLQADVSLEPGDIVYVPRHFIDKLEGFFKFFADNIKPMADTYLWYSIYQD